MNSANKIKCLKSHSHYLNLKMLLAGDISLIITVGLYGHQMIFCIRKTKKEKVGIHNH